MRAQRNLMKLLRMLRKPWLMFQSIVIVVVSAKYLEVLDVNFNTLEMRSQQTSDVTGLPTGFRDLDKITTGLHPGSINYFSGSPRSW